MLDKVYVLMKEESDCVIGYCEETERTIYGPTVRIVAVYESRSFAQDYIDRFNETYKALTGRIYEGYYIEEKRIIRST